MTKIPTRQCDECIHFSTDILEGACETDQLCEKHHAPHFYMPRSPMDLSYGYKRKCEDFVEAERKTVLKPS
jgi:hypothetical protein